MAGFEDAYKRYTESGQGQAVAGMYDQQTQANVNSLKATYDQNLASQQAAREQIGTTYQNSANNMQAQYERNRRNLNQQAAANGINTGAGSQQQLALQNVWNRDYGALQGQRARAYADADLAIANLQTNYQNAIQQAQAQGDYRKMAALLDDYNTQYNRQLQQAQNLAAYGDFSGYNNIYSSEQIENMRNSWIAQNPLLAYNTGAISADDYYRMTGQYAPGQTPAVSSSGGGGWTPRATDNDEEPATSEITVPEFTSQREYDKWLQSLINNGTLTTREAADLREDRSLNPVKKSSRRRAVPAEPRDNPIEVGG